METIEITDEMVLAGIAAINKLREVEAQMRNREDVEMTWADLLSASYAAMETTRRKRANIDRIMRELETDGSA